MSLELRPRRIAVLASSPENAGMLRTDIEMREIEEGLRAATRRDLFVLEKRVAVRPRDLQRVLIELEPDIVHFCGHGSRAGGLLLENDSGSIQEVTPDALADLFRLFTGKVQCVLLNACYSEVQAAAISKHVPFVIGMNAAVEDYAARRFTIGFYDALCAGRSIDFSFEIARNALRLEQLPDQSIPVLKRNNEIFLPQLTVTAYPELLKMSSAELNERSEFLRAGLRLFPEKWPLYLEIGLIQLHCGNHSEALRLLKQAVDLAPEVANTHYYYALACFRGRPPQQLDMEVAIEIEMHLRRASAINPDRSIFLYLWAILRQDFAFRKNIAMGGGTPTYDEIFRRARNLHHEPEEVERLLNSVLIDDSRLIAILRRKLAPGLMAP